MAPVSVVDFGSRYLAFVVPIPTQVARRIIADLLVIGPAARSSITRQLDFIHIMAVDRRSIRCKCQVASTDFVIDRVIVGPDCMKSASWV